MYEHVTSWVISACSQLVLIADVAKLAYLQTSIGTVWLQLKKHIILNKIK